MAAGAKLPLDLLYKLLELTYIPELQERVNELLPQIKKLYNHYLCLWDIEKEVQKKDKTCSYKTGKKPSLDYYDWHTENNYDWKDHYELYGKDASETVLSRRAKRK